MKLLIDQCVWRKTIDLLRLNFGVVTVGEIGFSTADDPEIISYAFNHDLVFITNDLDFSNILLYPPSRFNGVVVLRITPGNMEKVHTMLISFLKSKSLSDLRGSLVIIDTNHLRIRR